MHVFDLLSIYLLSGRFIRRGNRCLRRRDFAGAAEAYEQALTLRPNAHVVRFNLGIALYKAGRKREGREAWQAVLDALGDSKPYLAEQCRIMLRQFA